MIRLALLVTLAVACVPQAAIDEGMDRDGDGHVAWQLDGADCDDADATVRPGLDEVCGNDKDDDCDGEVDDDGIGASLWFPDNDGDGFGVDAPTSACTAPVRHIADLNAGIDCDDTENDVYPGHPEICANGDDDDCDGHIDDQGLGAPMWYPDGDGDGYAFDAPVQACSQPAGHLATLGVEDCDDLDPDVKPGATEVWYDGIDQDCDDDDDFDQDGDGFSSKAEITGGTDCDDLVAAVNPDATEICFNSRDDDCDSKIDDAGLGAATWYPDLDQDGFATNDPVQACTQPIKHRSTLGVVDCNDFDSTVKPGATEIWYDGTDQDCAANDDYDRDADGFRAKGEITGGTDCEDALPAVNPEATEICDNGLDDDCDTTANGCELLGTHDVAAIASSTIAQTNSSLGPFGQKPIIVDATDDGIPDIVAAGYANSVWIFKGPIPATATQNGAYAEFASVLDSAWDEASVGDFNGDGVPDIAIGRHDPRDVRIYYGPLTGYFDQSDEDVLITDPTGGTRFGQTVRALPDFDGDGHDELSVGAVGVTSGNPPAHYIFDGPYVDGWTVANRVARLYGRLDFDGTGSLSIPATLSSSSQELVVAASGDENYTGTVASFSPSLLTGDRSVVGNAIVVGVEAGAQEAFSIAVGDFDGDGVPDLAAGAPSVGSSKGAVYVVSGPFSKSSPKLLTDAFLTVSSTEVGGQFGAHVAALDFDGDGNTDLAVGSTLDAAPFRIYYGPLGAGTYAPADADVMLDGVGGFVFGSGDLDSDGKDDLVFRSSITTLRVVLGRGR